jgi:hypothetical protein
MRTDVSHMPRASATAAALCRSCHGPLENHRQTVLDTYVVELWWCEACNIWWGSGSSQHDVNDRASFSRTPPVALAARVDRLSSLDEQTFRRRS